MAGVNLNQVDLNLLVALDALLKERNVTRAGKRVNLSQPAMSAALARLRTLFEDPLLERAGREFRLTPCAVALGEPLQVALSAIERALARNEPFDPSTASRRFRIAVSDYLLLVLCTDLARHIAKIAPSVQLDLMQVSPQVTKQLETRQVDLAILPAGLIRNFAEQHVIEERWVCAVWRGHDTVKQRITLAQLAALPHATFFAGPMSISDRYLSPHLKTPPQLATTSQNFMSIPFLLTGTQQVALIQRSLGVYFQDAAQIRLLDPPVPLAKMRVAMCWNAMFTADAAHTWLRSVIVEVAREAYARFDQTPLR